ncbi:MAG: tyrosinase family protein [Bacteroidota bacterium]
MKPTHILTCLTLACCSLYFVACEAPQPDIPPSFERVDANTSPKAGTVLNLYAYGMNIIRSLDCTDPASWYYQGSMHAVPSIEEMGGYDSLCPSYTGTPMRAWNSCPHMFPTNQQLNFLTWHRLYIYYYELNIRHFIANGGAGFSGLGEEVANQFSLPYWDYTNQADMPTAFLNKASNYTTYPIEGINPLYEAGRSPTLLEGEGIDYASTDGIAVNVNGEVKNLCVRTMQQALDYDDFLSLHQVSEFSRGMEDRLHNVMHDYIGGAVDPADTSTKIYNRIFQGSKSGYGLMAYIPSAGFDPIFFLHHSNVDRMFAAWESLYDRITIEEMNQYAGVWDSIQSRYQFWDAATDSWVTYGNMQEMLDAAHAVQYTYESLPTLSTGVPVLRNRNLVKQEVHTIDTEEPEMLNQVGDPFEVSLAQATARQDTNARYKLEIDLSFSMNMFQQLVVLTIPPDQDWSACDIDPDFVHSVNAFFGSTHAMHAGMHGKNALGKEFGHQIFVDVTHAVQKLPEEQDKLEVFIVPIRGGDRPSFFVEKMVLYEYQ